VFVAVTSHLAWYVARSAGVLAWALASASIIWGLALSTRLIRRRGAPAWLLDLHRFLGVLTIVAVGVHLLGLWADSFVYFGWREMFVPMGSEWRPVAVLWGVVATYCLIAIQLTSWAMRRLPRKLWHSVHMTSAVVFVASTVHAFQAGTDAMNTLVQWLAFTGTIVIWFFLVFRVLADRRSKRPAAVGGVRANRPVVSVHAQTSGR
jgi:predicted ferric reductase